MEYLFLIGFLQILFLTINGVLGVILLTSKKQPNTIVVLMVIFSGLQLILFCIPGVIVDPVTLFINIIMIVIGVLGLAGLLD